jgi:hypothetical protein
MERRELEALARRRKTAQGGAAARIVLAAADGLYDEPRPGAPRRIGDDEVAAVICRTLAETPSDAKHWSLRSMASAVGHAPSTIHRIWRAFGLQPHRTETFKLSGDHGRTGAGARPRRVRADCRDR